MATEEYTLRSAFEKIQIAFALFVTIAAVCYIYGIFFSATARRRIENMLFIRELPSELKVSNSKSVLMGREVDLDIPIYLSNQIRNRHVHILGATGAGKTESVILNFLRQDVQHGFGSIILDAKGDIAFLQQLRKWIPDGKLKVFDLGDSQSEPYDSLCAGSPLEAAQRLFASLTWSEEYYRSKALSTIQNIFRIHFELHARNPTLLEIADYLETPESLGALTSSKMAVKEFPDILGLRDQIRSLTLGHLRELLSPAVGTSIDLSDAMRGTVIYFRLQSLLSSQLVTTVGRLIINHLNFLAGTAHRVQSGSSAFLPVFLDEFATFACPEFADLISKARSAGFALHFSHQSVGDLRDQAPGFLNRITDNSATKIILRINDPDSAEYFARCFGTKEIQKTTQRITNARDVETAEIVGEGTTRDAHQFRAPPDLLKTLPTGIGAVLVAHGKDTPHGASSVFTVKFQRV